MNLRQKDEVSQSLGSACFPSEEREDAAVDEDADTLVRIWAQEETEWIPENTLGGFGTDFGTLLEVKAHFPEIIPQTVLALWGSGGA